MVLVLQQHKTLGCQIACGLTVFWGIDIALAALLVEETVGIVKETQLVFSLQHATTGLVNLAHRHLTILQRLLQGVDEALGTHVHIGTCLQGHHRRLGQVAQSVLDDLGNGTIVGHHKAVPSPLLAQHIVNEPSVGGGGDIVHEVKRGHHRPCPCLCCSLVGRKELVVHPEVTHIDRVVVATCLGTAIQGIVLDAGHHVLGSVVALISLHHGLCDARTQERVFATALGNAPPSGIQRDIDHRTVGPADAIGRSLLGSNPR